MRCNRRRSDSSRRIEDEERRRRGQQGWARTRPRGLLQGHDGRIPESHQPTIGECTNLHITYPALVFGYLFVIRANEALDPAVLANPPPGDRAVKPIAPNDIAITQSRWPVESIIRFHSALAALTGRRGIREDASRYEAISLALIDIRAGAVGRPLPEFPPPDSPLRIEHFFETLYRRYDERYVYSAPDLKSKTRRLEWSRDSPALESDTCERLEFEIRHSSDPSTT